MMTKELAEHLCQQELALLRRYGVRLRVDKVTDDGRYALCSACQIKRPWFRRWLSDRDLAALAHQAVIRLTHTGLHTLVSAVPRGPMTIFRAVDAKDPFNLLTALQDHPSYPTGMNGRKGQPSSTDHHPEPRMSERVA